MMRHGKDTDEPNLHLDGDQPHLYRKRLRRRELKGRGEAPGETHLRLDGDQPQIYRRRRVRWTSILKWGALALVILLIVAFVWGFAWLKSKESRMRVS